jgi:glycerol-3-phosphate cytidylyltransferase|tara:strand:- start:49 stop:498 length:450 start_codon:yes stop_codon:yes gene_type:complete
MLIMDQLDCSNFTKGVIAGNFDVIHPGYISMFKEMSENCDCLVVLLHTDPSIERPEKLKPILTSDERKEMLLSIKYVDDVVRYTYEEQLYDLLKVGEFNLRFLGDDYIDKPFTGDDLKIPIHYLNRDHGWSTTKFKRLISESYEKANNS